MLAMTETTLEHIVDCITHADPFPSTESVYNECMSSRTGPWSNNRRWFGLMNYVSLGNRLYQDALWEEGKPAVFCWEMLSRGIRVDVILTRTPLFGSGLLQPQNEPFYTARIVSGMV